MHNIARLVSTLGLLLCMMLLLAACNSIVPAPLTPVAPGEINLSYDFRQGPQGWEGGFADYPPGEEANFQLDSGIKALPAGRDSSGTAFLITGNNHSDDLFMFLKRKIGVGDGVIANTEYTASFKIVFASNAPTGCSGIGGSPGSGVTLKAGVANVEPKAVVQGDIYQMNVDKGQQVTGGAVAGVVSDISNGTPCDQVSGEPRYVSLTKDYVSPSTVKSTSSGDLWALIGTDSGFEGTTTLYYQQIVINLVPKH